MQISKTERKKECSAIVLILTLLFSTLVSILLVNLARADATTFSDISLGTILPDSNTKPPVVSVFTPENYTVYATNTISLSINVSVGESSTAYSKYIEEVYYKTDWQINNTYIYESDPTKNVYSTEPAQFSKTLNLTGIPDGNHSLVVYAKERGAYHSHSDYKPPVWYFYYYLFEIDGSSTVFFTVDTTAPSISVLSMQDATFRSSDVELSFAVNEPTSRIAYSLDEHDNVTIDGNTTLSGLSSGLHNLTLYATDMYGNTGASETIYFSVDVPFPTALVAASVVIIGAGVVLYFAKVKKTSGKTK
jgi:hypothetical protein